ncbi:MAG: hypothetical protein GC168_04700 [Candidatus Hydrogenedens sp.]|nr:hypothetical protein [Candidatus Hydrogenedens sp.]
MQGLKWITYAALLAATVLAAPAAQAKLGVDWDIASTSHPFVSRQGTAFAEFDGKLWASGGIHEAACVEVVWTGGEWGWECLQYEDIAYTDVWYTTDGLTWTKVLDELPFETTAEGYELVAFKGWLYLFQHWRLSAYRTKDGVQW